MNEEAPPSVSLCDATIGAGLFLGCTGKQGVPVLR